MYYQINRETQKLELIFDKAEYMALSDAQKKEIKSNFLFSKSIGGWVSRCKSPNLYRAEKIAQSLGAENHGKVGESLSFGEQMERKAERAEARAERMDARSERATERGEALQKPINDMHGDIAFFTQPNINTSAGRAFTRRRNKMWDAYERGYEEFKKSAYYADRAETARKTASMTRPKDKAFCERRIADAQKDIRALRRSINEYETYLENMGESNEIKGKYGTTMTRGAIEEQLENWDERLEQALSKEIYYRDCLEELGGVQYNKDNIKVGYIVKVKRYGLNKVVGTGPKFFTYVDVSGRFPCALKASYGEIIEVVRAEEEKPQKHPYEVGEEFTIPVWNGNKYVNTLHRIVKATDKTVSVLNTITGKTAVRTPKIRNGYNSSEWAFFMDDNYRSGYFKPIENQGA